MPFIRYSPAEDRAAGRGPGKPAVLPRSVQAWMKAARADMDKWVPVRSSWVAAVRWNRKKGTFDMRVKKPTKAGRTDYPDYPDMNYDKFYNLLHVRSVGKWMWRWYPPRGKRRRRS